MTDPGATPPPAPDLDHLLVEIHLRMRQERYNEVEERLARVKAMAPDHPAVLELEGDLAFARRRFKMAEQLYHRACELEPENTRVEDKFANAVMKVHEPEFRAHQLPDDDESIWSFHVRRPIWASAALSALLPGLGQFYNGELLKGGVLVFVDMAFARYVINQAWYTMDGIRKQLQLPEGQPGIPVSYFPQLLHGMSIFVLMLLAAVWIYGIVDAVLVAKKSHEPQ